MPVSVILLLSVLLGLPAYYEDRETLQERTDRMTLVAIAIDQAASRATCSGDHASPECTPVWTQPKEKLAALLVTTGWWESRFSKHIHEGNCHRGECDEKVTRLPNGQELRVFRARTSWQMQKSRLVLDEWDHMQGADLESTQNAAWASAKVLSASYQRCKSIVGAISQYAGARSCRWSAAPKRFFTYEKVLSQLSASDAVR